jgi:uncharacterized phage infection (PIP) family protein YhgE
MMPNPWMILGAIAVCISAYFYGHHAGFAQRDQEMQAEIAKKNEQSRQAEHKLNEQINQTSTELKEANDAIAKKQSDLARLISAGRVRLPSPGCVQASASAPAAGGDSQDASESDRQTLLLIAQLAAEGDQAINRLNSCIDAYNEVRGAVNAQR